MFSNLSFNPINSIKPHFSGNTHSFPLPKADREDTLELTGTAVDGDPQTLDYYKGNTAKFADMSSRALIEAPEQNILTLRYDEAFGKFGPGAVIADIGCGAGSDLSVLLKKNCDAYGVDAVPELLERASAIYPGLEGRLHEGKLPSNLPTVLKGKCDGILCAATLQHLPKKQLPAALKELKTLLKGPGSRILISMPFGREGYNPETGRDSSGRLQLEYTPEELTRYFEDAGFKRIAFYGSNTDPSNRKLEWHNYIFELT